MSVKDTIDQRRLLTIDQFEEDAETKTFLKLTNKQVSYDSSRTGHILFWFILFHIKYNLTSKKNILITLACIVAALLE